MRFFITLAAVSALMSARAAGHRLIEAGDGYSRTSVNSAVFRESSLATHGDTQYIAYYNPQGHVMVGKRKLGSDRWTLSDTGFTGNIADGHNVISMGVDGRGYLHLSFDHHGNPLRYARSVEPGGLEFMPLSPMTGNDENDVTYPEFHTMPDGRLLFAYRSGASGNGNLVLNGYDPVAGKWERIQDVLIDGEGKRNAYWQMHVDENGMIHVSWVWRETWMVETNHDLCYAQSTDGGRTWRKSDGSPYTLPITLESAETVWKIPQNSELINQTSMTADSHGNPYIATYWRDADSNVPQYRLVWHDGYGWHAQQVGKRTAPFSLSGGGTKMIPISRPRIVSDGRRAWYVFRDEERGSKVSLAYTPDLASGSWTTEDLTDFPVDAWEPSIDTNLWNEDRKLHIFVQETHQGDGEKVADDSPASSKVYVLEYSINETE